jgi:hypothetical protein
MKHNLDSLIVKIRKYLNTSPFPPLSAEKQKELDEKKARAKEREDWIHNNLWI